MKCVRHEVFETNSSSSHSLTIAADGNLTDALPLVNGICEVYPGEFGWGVEEFWDAATKASYCLTYAMRGGPDNSDEEQLAMLTTVLTERMGAEVKFRPVGDEFYEWGYIDHQSDWDDGNACGVAFADRESLAAFIFNPRSRLLIDNDNH